MFSFPYRRALPFIPQMEMAECGAASLGMVMAFYGCNIPLSELRRACGVSRDGTTALGIVRAAEKYGFRARGVKLEPENLADLHLPAILHWGFSHFVVLESVNKACVKIVDPGMGRLAIPFEQLNSAFTGIAIDIVPTAAAQERKKEPSPLWDLFNVARGLRTSLVQLLSASLLAQSVGLFTILTIQMIIDRIGKTGYGARAEIICILFLVSLFKAILDYVRGGIIQRVQMHLDRTLRSAVLKHLLKLPLSFIMQRRAGDLVSRIHGNSLIRDFFTELSISTVFDGLFIVLYLCLMAFYSLPLTMCVSAGLIVRALMHLVIRKDSRAVGTAELVAVGREWSALIEALSSVEAIVAARAQEEMSRRALEAVEHRVYQQSRRRTLDNWSTQVAVALNGLILAIIVFVGLHELLGHTLSLGGFAACIALQASITRPFDTVLSFAAQLQPVRIHLLRLNDIFESEPQAASPHDAPCSAAQFAGAVSFDDVSFSYSRQGKPLLRNIRFHIASGEKIAILGRSGSGKSTIVRLLLGLLEPTAGSITYGGHLGASAMQPAPPVRAAIACVLQDCWLFNDTIRNNLTMNDPSVAYEEILEALDSACILDDVLSWPEGIDTCIQQDGRLLSGGQRQRLCLARALLRKPQLLILDEATASLDADLRRRIYDNILQLDCTCLVVTHQLNNLERFDRLFVLENGQLTQEGAFRDLCLEEGPLKSFLTLENNSAP
jgi:ATP-binding cassette subfamily B protein